MTLYKYTRAKKSVRRKTIRFFSFILVITGLGILSSVLYPILSFELIYRESLKGIVNPVPQINGKIIKETLEVNLPEFLGTETIDYTKASNWFPKATPYQPSFNEKITTYTLSIPKVKVENALVRAGSDDLSKSLIHFAGPLPGSNGNTVIFGHSTLLWFYNPKDYTTIFSKLPELKDDDEIIVNADSVTYHYRVLDRKVVSPDDLSVLTQETDASYISLITCVPPGTVFKRLVVKAKLITI